MRRVEHGPQAFQAPVDVHASADGHVFFFKRRENESAASSDDEEHSLVEMTQQVYQEQEQDRLRNVQLLEREVLDGDSLSKLALQYGCKVADIKRINNLMQEQDLFALKSIKIPVQKRSLLTETRTDLRDPQEEMLRASAAWKPQDRPRTHQYLKEGTDFLMEVENDTERLIPTTNDQDEDLDKTKKQQWFGLRATHLRSHSADWGIQWWNVVVAMLLIGVILPLFYVIYFKMKNKTVISLAAGAIQSPTTSPSASGAVRGMDSFQEQG